MFKFMLMVSAVVQMFISTSIELIGNERGQVLDDPPPVEPVVEPTTPPVPPVEPPKPLDKNEILRELSKEHGVNLFDVEGLTKFKEFTDNQKSDLDKANEVIESYKTKETEWANKQLEYESKLKASELGIPSDKLEDALKLADGDVSKLAEVVKKYPILKTKKGIKIGVTDPNNFQDPNGLSDLEKYKAANPQIYGKK